MNLIELEDALHRVSEKIDCLPEDIDIGIEIPVTVRTRRVGLFRKVETVTCSAGFTVAKIFFDAQNKWLVIRGE